MRNMNKWFSLLIALLEAVGEWMYEQQQQDASIEDTGAGRRDLDDSQPGRKHNDQSSDGGSVGYRDAFADGNGGNAQR